MPFKIAVFALFAFFTILPVSKSIAATEFFTDDSAVWTTTDTNTATSTTTSSMATDSISLDASASSASQSTSTQSYQSARHGYDELDRLKWTQYEDGTVISYDYDKVGNRTAKNTYQGTLGNFTITSSSSVYGTIIPSGVITVPSGSTQTLFIEPGLPPNGTSCPPSHTYSTARNRCEAPLCPSLNQTYNAALNQCEQPITSTYQATCASGQGTLNASNMCQYAACSTGSPNPGTMQCEYSATAVNYTTPVYITGGIHLTAPVASLGRATTTNPQYQSSLYGYLSAAPFPGSVPIYYYPGDSCIDQLDDFSPCSNDLNGPLSSDSSSTLAGYASTSPVPFSQCDFDGNCQIAYAGLSGGSDAGGAFYPNNLYAASSTSSAWINGTSGIGYSCPNGGSSNGSTVCQTTSVCANGGTLSGSICLNSPVCASGGTLSGLTCSLTTGTNVSPPNCQSLNYDSAASTCFSYLTGTLTSFSVDNIPISIGTLPFMPGQYGPKYYYTFTNVAKNHTLTATFSAPTSVVCTDYPARLTGATTVNYVSLQSAYNAAANGNTVQGSMYDHFESLRLDRNVAVTLDGGYSCDYSSKTGNLTIKGEMTIANGSVIVSGNIILAEP